MVVYSALAVDSHVQAKFMINAMPCSTFTVLRNESRVVSKVGVIKMI